MPCFNAFQRLFLDCLMNQSCQGYQEEDKALGVSDREKNAGVESELHILVGHDGRYVAKNFASSNPSLRSFSQFNFKKIQVRYKSRTYSSPWWSYPTSSHPQNKYPLNTKHQTKSSIKALFKFWVKSPFSWRLWKAAKPVAVAEKTIPKVDPETWRRWSVVGWVMLGWWGWVYPGGWGKPNGRPSDGPVVNEWNFLGFFPSFFIQNRTWWWWDFFLEVFFSPPKSLYIFFCSESFIFFFGGGAVFQRMALADAHFEGSWKCFGNS